MFLNPTRVSFKRGEVQSVQGATNLGLEHRQELRGATSMRGYAQWPPFSNLDSRRRELDQGAKEVGRRSRPSMNMPERFPALMGFPVITLVE